MRSRNGNRSLLFTVCSLVLFTPLLQADIYRIGYQAVVENAILVDETLNISRAMTPCFGKVQSYLKLDSSHTHNIHALLKEHNETFYEYLLHHALHVRHREQLINQQSHSLTTLTFPTQCFKVTFKGNLAKIALIK